MEGRTHTYVDFLEFGWTGGLAATKEGRKAATWRNEESTDVSGWDETTYYFDPHKKIK